MTIGLGSSKAKVAQAISQVRGEIPDWLELSSLTRSASNIIDGVCTKLKIPSGFTAQIASNANYFMSKMTSGGVYDLGRVLQHYSKGCTVANLVTDGTAHTHTTSLVPSSSTMFPDDDIKLHISYLNSTTAEYVDYDATAVSFERSMASYVGPLLTFRNDSYREIQLYVGTCEYEKDNATNAYAINSYFSFRLAPNAYLDSW